MSEQAQGDALKQQGTVAYKERRFDEAIEKYSRAWETYPKDVVYLNNLAAAYFEQGSFDKCISTCEQAVDEARSLRADYKVIAKALARIGSAYVKKEDYPNAVKFFNKSLAEHRAPDVLQKLKDAEKASAEAEKLAYINPELADKARAEGNVQFKAGDFAGSVQSYTEAIKRAPEDSRGYTNRCSAYIKLLALHEALKDAETAIKVDPAFAKGYIRKANVKFAMKDYTQALEACQEARAVDKDGKANAEIGIQERKCMEAQFTAESTETDEERLQRASRDPETAALMNDPVLMSILQQAQSDPKVLQAHMANEDFRRKIAKLQASGIIRLGSK